MILKATTKPQAQRAAAGDPPGGSSQVAGESPTQALRRAAEIVEKAAYDAAGTQQPSWVSQLIIIAAELERLAQVSDDAPPPG